MTDAAILAAGIVAVQQKSLAMSAYNIGQKGVVAGRSIDQHQSFIVAQHADETGAGTPVTAAGDMQNTNKTLGVGVKVVGQSRNMQQGSVRTSNNPYHLMLQGSGWFVVTAANGRQYYTRAGNFSKNNEGQLVTHKGYVVSPGIAVPNNATAVRINENGLVTATVEGEAQELGQLDIAVFANEEALKEVSDNMYEPSDPNAVAILGQAGVDGRGTILQGALEGSNVETVSEVINVLDVNTTVSFLMKIIEADKKNGEAIAQAA